jgi:hypothetical protein
LTQLFAGKFLSVKDPVLVGYWDLPPPPPSGMRPVLRVDNPSFKASNNQTPGFNIYNHGSSSFLRSNNHPENDPFSHETNL